MKVAIVCDWLTGTGGAERVVLQLHKMFPEAPIYTSQYDSDPAIWYGDEWFSGADIRTGWLQKLPPSLKKFLPLFRFWYFSHLNLDEYDLVISSSGAEAKAVKTKSGTKHVSYIHAPTHYYWMRYDDYLKNPGFGRADPLARWGLKLLVGPLRKFDYKAAQRPDYLLANSRFTAAQIQKYYGRQATVVHPPVDVERFDISVSEPRRGFITAGRQTPYKKIDLAVAACSELNLPLIVIGNGPDNRRLRKLAGKSVTFLRNVDDKQLAHYFKTSSGFIFPGVDDFGIVAVEALAAGTPVIAYGQGGALDYINGKTGLLFKEQSVKSLCTVLKSFEDKRFNESAISQYAQRFSAAAFRDNLQGFLKKLDV